MVLSLLAIFLLIGTLLNNHLIAKKSNSQSLPVPTFTPIQKPNAEVLFTLINEWRKSEGLNIYIKDERLCKIAVDRSDDGFDQHKGLFEKYSQYPFVISENIVGLANEETMLESWLESKSHRAALEKSYIYSCVACNTTCIQIFSSFQP